MKQLSLALLVAWWVQVFGNGQFLHGGVYPTVDQCRIAGRNLVDSYRALGYTNVYFLCVNHGGRG